MIDGNKSVHTPKSASMINRDCRITAQEMSAHDQKYKPRRRLKSRNKETLISTPMYQEMPVKAAIVMASGRSCLRSLILRWICVASHIFSDSLLIKPTGLENSSRKKLPVRNLTHGRAGARQPFLIELSAATRLDSVVCCIFIAHSQTQTLMSLHISKSA